MSQQANTTSDSIRDSPIDVTVDASNETSPPDATSRKQEDTSEQSPQKTGTSRDDQKSISASRPLSNAERCRRYRSRKRATTNLTVGADKSSSKLMTEYNSPNKNKPRASSNHRPLDQTRSTRSRRSQRLREQCYPIYVNACKKYLRKVIREEYVSSDVCLTCKGPSCM